MIPRSPQLSRVVVGALCATLMAACSFDDSRLSQAVPCDDDGDCLSGQCFDGFCFAEPSDNLDLGGSDLDGPGPGPDAGGGDTGLQVDSGGDDTGNPIEDTGAPDTGTPDTGRPDTGGSDQPIGVDTSDDPGCSPVNACGGCSLLIREPGTPCSTERCGVYVCDGPDLLMCEEGDFNACGGCEALEGEPGDPCGACGGELTCDGTEALTCGGRTANECGGCGGPTGELGVSCGCEQELDDGHQWACNEDQLACLDDNDAREQATTLPDASDVMDNALVVDGALVEGETADWFVVTVIDLNSTDGMFPDIGLSGLSQDHDLCAFFEYVNGDEPELRCDAGALSESGGLMGCCSANGGTADEVVRIRRDNPWGSERLDIQGGEGNDNARVYIAVVGEPALGCEPYQVSYRF